MSDYISRNAAIEAMYKDAEANPNHTFWTSQHEALMDIPAADVRPVVLCRDCEMANHCTDDREMYCTLNHCYKRKNYFCADGR